jgi:hypothetical protein
VLILLIWSATRQLNAEEIEIKQVLDMNENIELKYCKIYIYNIYDVINAKKYLLMMVKP